MQGSMCVITDQLQLATDHMELQCLDMGLNDYRPCRYSAWIRGSMITDHGATVLGYRAQLMIIVQLRSYSA